MSARKSEKYISIANTKRYKKSPILHMQKLLNQLYSTKRKIQEQ